MLSISIENHVKFLNEWDVYPIISTVYSGPARILAAAVQIIAGTALAIVSVVFGWLINRNAWMNDFKTNFKEIGHGMGNLIRGVIATCPFVGNLAIYLYEKSSGAKVVLKRDADGYYTLPHVNVPGFVNMGTFKGHELNIRFGSFVVDTANGILPEGWVLG
jgi:hypothetical protein